MKIDKPDKQLGFLLMQVSLLKQRVINFSLKALNLTYMQFVVLAGILELGKEEKCVTQKDLVEHRRLDKAMVSMVVKTLESRCLIIKEKHPIDQRAFNLSLTEEGERLAIAGKRIAKEVDQNFFAGVDNNKLRIMFEQLLSANNHV